MARGRSRMSIFWKSAGSEGGNLSFVDWFRRDLDGTRKSDALLCHGKKTRREIEGQGANIHCESVPVRRIGVILTLTNQIRSAHLAKLVGETAPPCSASAGILACLNLLDHMQFQVINLQLQSTHHVQIQQSVHMHCLFCRYVPST